MSFVSNIVGSLIGAEGTRKASSMQAQATRDGIAEQQRQFDLLRQDQSPYREAGARALGQFEALANTQTSAADAMADPGYAWAQEQGQQAIDRKVAAAGGRVSGAAIKAASRFNTGNATQYYGQADARRNDRLNRLAALAGIGQTATAQTGQAGMNTGNQISNLLTAQGNAAGGAAMAQGNLWGNTANQLAALYQRSGTGGGLGSASSLVNGGGFTNTPAYLIQDDDGGY